MERRTAESFCLKRDRHQKLSVPARWVQDGAALGGDLREGAARDETRQLRRRVVHAVTFARRKEDGVKLLDRLEFAGRLQHVRRLGPESCLSHVPRHYAEVRTTCWIAGRCGWVEAMPDPTRGRLAVWARPGSGSRFPARGSAESCIPM